MKKWMLVVLVLAGSVSWGQAQIKIGNRTINTKKVLNAASEVASAITLSDEDVAALCRESVKWMDEQNPVSDPGSAYSKRLDSLMKGLQSEQVNFENATDMIDRTLKIIENDIVNNGKGRGGQKECMDLLQRLRNVELEMLEVKLQEKHRSMNGSMIMGQKI